MLKKTSIVLLVLMSLFIGSSIWAAGDDLAAQISAAEKLFQAWDDPANLIEAGAIYESLLEEYPDNYELLWKAARCYEKFGNNIEDPLATYEKGKERAEKATQLYPDQVEGHYWLAALMGRVGEEKGILNSLFMVKPMKTELEQCLEIDPQFPDAYYVLGKLYWKVPGWPLSVGDKKKAVEYALKSVELNPDSFVFQWGLYEAYNAAGKKKDAKETLEQIIQMPIKPGYELDGAEYKERAQEI